MRKIERFAFVLPNLKFGGAERAALNLADALQARGWRVEHPADER